MVVGEDAEREELEGFADWFRMVVTNKVRGLPTDEATRVSTPSGMTALSVIKHLAWVEGFWYATHFAGDEPDQRDNASSFTLAPDDTTESVIAEYEAACDRSRRIAAAAPSLDTMSTRSHWHFHLVTLRWVLIHMVEETARQRRPPRHPPRAHRRHHRRLTPRVPGVLPNRPHAATS